MVVTLEVYAGRGPGREPTSRCGGAASGGPRGRGAPGVRDRRNAPGSAQAELLRCAIHGRVPLGTAAWRSGLPRWFRLLETINGSTSRDTSRRPQTLSGRHSPPPRTYGRYSTPFTDGAPGRFGSAVPIKLAVARPAPTRRHSASSSSIRRTGSVGSAKMAVPTWTATAPTARKSRTSDEVRDATDRDDRDLHRLGRLEDDPQRDRLDRRPGQAAVRIAEQRSLPTRPDGDARQRVDRRQGVGAGLLDGPGDRPDVGDVRRQLHEQWQVRRRRGRRRSPRRPRRHRWRTGARPRRRSDS